MKTNTTKKLSLVRRIGIGMALIVAGAGIGGCREDASTDFTRDSNYKGYVTRVAKDGLGRHINISEANDKEKHVYARDWDNDGRFDEIRIYVPKGHPLEKLANLENFEEAYKN